MPGKTKQTNDAAPRIQLSTGQVVDFMRIEGSFGSALEKVIERRIVAEAAQEAGVRVTARELQRAADDFRAIHGLHKASDTRRWLAVNGLTLEALEDHLRSKILGRKFRDRLAKGAPKRLREADAVKRLIQNLAYEAWLSRTLP